MNRKSIYRLAFAIVILCFFLSTFVSLWSLRIMAQQNLQALGEDVVLVERAVLQAVGRLVAPHYDGPLGVDMLDNSRKRENGTECILCLECVKNCPKDAL